MRRALKNIRKKFLSVLMVLGLLSIGSNLFGADYYSVASGNWNTPGTWSNTDQGTPLTVGFPVAGDVVYITRGWTVTINITDAACASLQLGKVGGNQVGTGALNFAASGNPALTVSGAVVLGGTSNINGNTGTI